MYYLINKDILVLGYDFDDQYIVVMDNDMLPYSLKDHIKTTEYISKETAGMPVKKSQNVLIAMLEELVSEKDAAEKKHILTDEYGMIMTAELEGRIQVMCNWSESIEARGFEKGIICRSRFHLTQFLFERYVADYTQLFWE